VHSLLLGGLATAALAGCFTSTSTQNVDAGPGPADSGTPTPDATMDSGDGDAADAGPLADADAGKVPEAGDATAAADAPGEAGPPPPADPFPDAAAPGLYCCTGCPQVDVTSLVDAGYVLASVATPTQTFSGTVTGATVSVIVAPNSGGCGRATTTT